ncbi:MAG: phage tail protein, partial [Neisseria sp.]|nr:phage tail protein [Neisseria sp.]
ARVVKLVADNLNIVIPIVAALGGLLLATVVPAIVSSMTAMLGLNAAMLANPIGIVVAAVAGLIALLYTFRDEISICGMSVSDWATTAGHAFDIVVETITGLVMPVIEQLQKWWGDLTEFVNEKVGGWQALFDAVMSAIGAYVSLHINTVINIFQTAYYVITGVWNNAPQFFAALGNAISNAFSTAIANMVNWCIDQLNSLISFANSATARLPFGLGSGLQMDLIQKKAGGGSVSAAFDGVAGMLGQGWEGVKERMGQDHVGKVFKRAQARTMAGKQRDADNAYGGGKSGGGKPSSKPAGGGRKGGSGRKGGKKGGSGKKGSEKQQDPMQAWEEEIKAQKLAFEEMQLNAEEHREWDLKAELAYWQKKLATVDKNSKTGIKLREKILGLQKELRKKQLEDERRSIQEAEKIAQHKLDMEQENALHLLETAEASQLQRLDAEENFERRRYELKREALLKLAALEEAAGNTDKARQIRDGIADLERGEEGRRQKSGHKREQTRKGEMPTFGEMMKSGGKNVWKEAENQLGQALTGMLTRTQSFRKSMQQAFKAISQTFMQEMVTKPLMQTMQRLVQESALWQMFFGTKNMLETEAATKTATTKTTETSTVVGQNATQAGSGAAAALASIPYVGPALAVAGMAAMIAAVMALIGGGGGGGTTTTTTRIPSAAGGWDIPAGLNPLTQLHENEMVLPAEHAQTIRDMAGQSSGGETVIINTTGGDFIHKKDLAKLMRQMNRDFKFVGR